MSKEINKKQVTLVAVIGGAIFIVTTIFSMLMSESTQLEKRLNSSYKKSRKTAEILQQYKGLAALATPAMLDVADANISLPQRFAKLLQTIGIQGRLKSSSPRPSKGADMERQLVTLTGITVDELAKMLNGFSALAISVTSAEIKPQVKNRDRLNVKLTITGAMAR